ncbi:MAG: hypothetical protein HZB31_06905 [Nitrospirae bacterium]|nr:hypothetical protein [Nitrospirota bacterium]
MKFKAEDWVRKVRDENYEKSKRMSPEDKIARTRKVAETFAKKNMTSFFLDVRTNDSA